MSSSSRLDVRCCIVGGGPAGIMLGFLLARAGVEVAVLEKHADFFRDFRGDTIHPSTLELMYELGLLEDFLAQPHDEVRHLSGFINQTEYHIADFTHVPTHCKFLALMPQWDFLNFIANHAKTYPGFHLLMATEATDLLREGSRITGVRASGPQGELEIHAALTVGADGRSSVLRDAARMRVRDFGAPMDVLWMRIPREPSDPGQAFGYVRNGRILVMIYRADYWQCGYIIPKGSFITIQENGLASFRDRLARIAPFLKYRLAEGTETLKSWDDVKLLTVKVDRLGRWYMDGLLFIGDAAHAMSPIGGVGINLAIQDAVATANILHKSLQGLSLTVPVELLRSVQRRRAFPTVVTQIGQVMIQRFVITKVLHDQPQETPGRGPWPLELLRKFPKLQRIPARVVGVGVRPEHISSSLQGDARV